MGKANGKGEVERKRLDAEHELPPAEEDGFEESAAAADVADDAPAAEDELARVRAERDQLLDRIARQQAEFENVRKRAAREQRDFKDYAVTEAVQSLLPVLDSFERALKTAPGSEFRSGVELIHKQLADALARLGVRAIAAEGEPFDPRHHEAVEVVESTAVADHHVLEELQRGYMLKERLLRPAMVRVAKHPKK
ncbi:MAG: nucleotide exchange factor GrpE [Acidobacteriota bacterium]|nr:nucleotide exchange factor GrpE [Acidobacteriota bacterium]